MSRESPRHPPISRGRRVSPGLPPECADLFEMASPFLGEGGVLRLLEPPGSCADALAARLVAGEYEKPFLLEHDGRRCLHFSPSFVQSAMRLADPDALDLAYTQRMMSFLLFQPRPRRLLLIGMGGGSLAKFCRRRLPATHVTVLEIDPHVIAFRDAFRVPPDDERFTVVHGDGVRYLAELEARQDVILVDAFDRQGVAPALADPGFYENVLRRLTGSGIFVMNLAGPKEALADHLARLGGVFADRVITLSIREDGNCIAFAFRNPAFEPRWKWLKSIALDLRRRFGLDFPRFAEQMERARKSRSFP